MHAKFYCCLKISKNVIDFIAFCSDGTGPFETCWTIKGPNYNSTGNETCTQGTETWNVCQFPIQWYFRRPGQSAIIIIVDNVLNHEVKQVSQLAVHLGVRKGEVLHK